MLKGIIASMEAYEAREGIGSTDTEVTDTTVTDVVDNAQLETELLDVQEQVDEVDHMEDELDDGIEAVEALESLIESTKYILKNGGFNKASIAMRNHAKDSIYARLGIYPNDKLLAMESFNDNNPEKNNSMVIASLEEEASTFQKVKEALKKFITMIIENVSKVMTGLFSSSGQVIKRAEQLKKDIGVFNTAGELSDEQKGKFGKLFAISGKVGPLVNITRLINAASAKANTQAFGDFILDWAKVRADFLGRNGESVASPMDIARAEGALADNFSENNFIKSQWNKGEGRYEASKPLPGGYGFMAYKHEELFTFKFGKVEADSNGVKFDVANMPKDKGEIIEIANTVIKIAENSKKKSDLFKKQLDAIKNLGANIKPKPGNEKEANKFFSQYKACVSSLNSVVVGFNNYSIRKCKEILDVAFISIKGPRTVSDEAPKA